MTVRMKKKLIITYDPISEQREAYFHYLLGEFVPTLEQMGLKMCEAWHTAYGEYPLRLTAFTAQEEVDVEKLIDTEEFRELESRLLNYVVNYHRRLVSDSNGFQF
ncbi:MAG: hypothetical protein ACK2T2_00160 [Anaerolineales bacterium]|jgi:hypothetical protein